MRVWRLHSFWLNVYACGGRGYGTRVRKWKVKLMSLVLSADAGNLEGTSAAERDYYYYVYMPFVIWTWISPSSCVTRAFCHRERARAPGVSQDFWVMHSGYVHAAFCLILTQTELISLMTFFLQNFLFLNHNDNLFQTQTKRFFFWP